MLSSTAVPGRGPLITKDPFEENQPEISKILESAQPQELSTSLKPTFGDDPSRCVAIDGDDGAGQSRSFGVGCDLCL